MELTPRLRLMNWLVSQGLTGLPENDLIRGFCERCRAEGLELSRGLVFIDTLHPIFEGRGFRWNDTEINESDSFEYGSTSAGDAAQNWRRSTFYHMLEHGQEELRIDLAESASFDFSMIAELAQKGHREFIAFVHRFGEGGTIGAAGSGAGARACDQIGSASGYCAYAGARLSRTRRLGAGVARTNLARGDRAHSFGVVVFRSARLDRHQREHVAGRDHSVP